MGISHQNWGHWFGGKVGTISMWCFLTRVPSGTWKTWIFEFYLPRSRNSLAFVQKDQNNEKTWTKQ